MYNHFFYYISQLLITKELFKINLTLTQLNENKTKTLLIPTYGTKRVSNAAIFIQMVSPAIFIRGVFQSTSYIHRLEIEPSLQNDRRIVDILFRSSWLLPPNVYVLCCFYCTITIMRSQQSVIYQNERKIAKLTTKKDRPRVGDLLFRFKTQATGPNYFPLFHRVRIAGCHDRIYGKHPHGLNFPP